MDVEEFSFNGKKKNFIETAQKTTPYVSLAGNGLLDHLQLQDML